MTRQAGSSKLPYSARPSQTQANMGKTKRVRIVVPPDLKGVDVGLYHLGMERIQVAKDGSCLFRAVAQQYFGTQEKHFALRIRCADYIKMHQEDFRAFLDRPVEKYLEALRSPKYWGGEPEVVALHRMLRRDIVIYKEEPNSRVVPKKYTECSMSSKDSVRLVFMEGDHYDAVVLRQWKKNAAFCQSIVTDLLFRRVLQTPPPPPSAVEKSLASGGGPQEKDFPQEVLQMLSPVQYRNIAHDLFEDHKQAQEDKDLSIAMAMHHSAHSTTDTKVSSSGGSQSSGGKVQTRPSAPRPHSHQQHQQQQHPESLPSQRWQESRGATGAPRHAPSTAHQGGKSERGGARFGREGPTTGARTSGDRQPGRSQRFGGSERKPLSATTITGGSTSAKAASETALPPPLPSSQEPVTSVPPTAASRRGNPRREARPANKAQHNTSSSSSWNAGGVGRSHKPSSTRETPSLSSETTTAGVSQHSQAPAMTSFPRDQEGKSPTVSSIRTSGVSSHAVPSSQPSGDGQPLPGALRSTGPAPLSNPPLSLSSSSTSSLCEPSPPPYLAPGTFSPESWDPCTAAGGGATSPPDPAPTSLLLLDGSESGSEGSHCGHFTSVDARLPPPPLSDFYDRKFGSHEQFFAAYGQKCFDLYCQLRPTAREMFDTISPPCEWPDIIPDDHKEAHQGAGLQHRAELRSGGPAVVGPRSSEDPGSEEPGSGGPPRAGQSQPGSAAQLTAVRDRRHTASGQGEGVRNPASEEGPVVRDTPLFPDQPTLEEDSLEGCAVLTSSEHQAAGSSSSSAEGGGGTVPP